MKIVTHTVVTIVALLFVFLMFSFYAVSFDISKWTADTRFVCVLGFFAGGVIANMIAMVPEVK